MIDLTKYRPLYEKMGLPNDIEEWFYLIYETLVLQIVDFRDAVKENPEEGVEILETDDEEIHANTALVYMDNFDEYVRANISKDNRLKLRSLNLSFGITILPLDEFNLAFFSGAYSDNDAVFRKGYLFGAKLELEVFLPDDILDTETTEEVERLMKRYGITSKITQYLSHELTHAYEFFNRTSSGQEVGIERLLNFLVFLVKNDDISKLSNDWIKLMDMVYLSLSFEVNARIAQLGYYMKHHNVTTKDRFIERLKSSPVYKEMESLKNYNAKLFYQRFILGMNAKRLLKKILEEGIIDKTREEDTMVDVALRLLIKKWDSYIPKVNQEFEKYGKSLEPVPQKAIDDPLLFLKFFEDRFHRKWEDFERRAYRLWGHFDQE